MSVDKIKYNFLNPELDTVEFISTIKNIELLTKGAKLNLLSRVSNHVFGHNVMKWTNDRGNEFKDESETPDHARLNFLVFCDPSRFYFLVIENAVGKKNHFHIKLQFKGHFFTVGRYVYNIDVFSEMKRLALRFKDYLKFLDNEASQLGDGKVTYSHGFKISQCDICRDILDMSVVKVAKNYYNPIYNEGMKSWQEAPNSLVNADFGNIRHSKKYRKIKHDPRSLGTIYLKGFKKSYGIEFKIYDKKQHLKDKADNRKSKEIIRTKVKKEMSDVELFMERKYGKASSITRVECSLNLYRAELLTNVFFSEDITEHDFILSAFNTSFYSKKGKKTFKIEYKTENRKVREEPMMKAFTSLSGVTKAHYEKKFHKAPENPMSEIDKRKRKSNKKFKEDPFKLLYETGWLNAEESYEEIEEFILSKAEEDNKIKRIKPTFYFKNREEVEEIEEDKPLFYSEDTIDQWKYLIANY